MRRKWPAPSSVMSNPKVSGVAEGSKASEPRQPLLGQPWIHVKRLRIDTNVRIALGFSNPVVRVDGPGPYRDVGGSPWPGTPKRSRPLMSSSHPITTPCQWFSSVPGPSTAALSRLVLLLLTTVLVRGRRTVTSGIRAAKLTDRFQPCDAAIAPTADERRAGIVPRQFANADVPGCTS